MRTGYKIGEVAKLFNISNRTLIHYDQINLFKPDYVDQENGYRYYSSHQILELYFILILKNSGFSLKDIKEYTQSRNIQESIDFLKSKEELIDIKIEELKKTKMIIREKQEEFEKILLSDEIAPSIIYAGPFQAIIENIESPFDGIEIGKIYNKLFSLEKDLNFKDKKYIAIVDKSDLNKKEFSKLKKLGILIPEDEKYSSEILTEKRKFATITHKDSYESLEESYKKLLDFIQINSYNIVGDSIEISNEWMLQLEKGIGGIVKILIPIEKINYL